MFGNNDGFTKHPTKSTTVINEPPSSVLPLIYLNMCDSFLGQHLALLFVTLRYTWWLKRAATTAEASAVCTFSFAKAYTVTCLVESLCGVFTPGCTRLTNVKLSQAFKELAQWQESTSMTIPETVRWRLCLRMEEVDKHWCPWNPTWTGRATRWLWEKRPTSTRLCIFGFRFALNLHTKRLCLVSIFWIGGASSHSTGYKPMNETYINLVLAQLWVCYEWTNPTYYIPHGPMDNWSSTASPGGNSLLTWLQGLLQCQSGEEHQGGRWIA